MSELFGQFVFCGDVLDILDEIDDEEFDAVFCDPPYGLSDKGSHDVVNGLLDVFSNFVFPDFEEFYPEIAEKFDLSGVTLDGSSLCRRKIRAVVNSGIGVPESPVDLDGNALVLQEEIKAGNVPACLGVTNPVLPGEVNAEGGQFFGDFVLDFRDTVDFARHNILSGDFAETGSGFVSMPVSVVVFHPLRQSLPVFDSGFAPGFRNFIGLRDNTLGESGGSPGVMTGAGAVDSFMLRFDVRRDTIELVATGRTSQGDASSQLPRPKLIGALPTTSGLSSVFDPVRVRLVSDVTDGASPGYFHLWFRKGSFDKIKTKLPQNGFMGKSWDHGVPSKGVWREVMRVLKPGGHCLAFGGTRTYHRLAVNIEDAGFECRDTFCWLYGSGFPKAHDISKALDKKAGAEREVIGEKKQAGGMHRSSKYRWKDTDGDDASSASITAPATQAAQAFDGYKTALKPAWEPIVVAMKPKSGTYADNALEYGVAGLNIDGGRISGTKRSPGYKNPGSISDVNRVTYEGGYQNIQQNCNPEEGRFPANLILDPFAADLLDDQAGDEKSRFFYTAKASKAEREAGLDGEGRQNKHPCVKPIDLCRYFTKLLLPPKRTDGEPRKILVPFSGSGSEMIGAMLAGWDCVVGIEMNEEYCEIARKRLAHWRDEKDTGGGRFCPTPCDKCEGVSDEHIEEINRPLRGEQLEFEGVEG